MPSPQGDIVVTLPKHWDFDQWWRECEEATEQGLESLYHVSNLPRHQPKRVFILHRGKVRAYQTKVRCEYLPDGFVCKTAGRRWPPGYYIIRDSQPYEYDGPWARGFQNWRYRWWKDEGEEIAI